MTRWWVGMSAAELGMKWLKSRFDLWIPDGLEDYRAGWRIALVKASLKSQVFGHLVLCQQGCRGCSACLWRVAGARHQDFFRKEGPVVIADWEQGQIAGRRVLFLPAVVECIDEQLKLMKAKKGLFQKENSTDIHSSTGSLSNLSFDFEVKEKKEAENCVPPELSERMRERRRKECESNRRRELTRMRETGWRDWKKYPLEDWEKPATKTAVAGD